MKHDLGVITCDICQDEIVKERDDGLHYPRNDYHIGCFIARLRKANAIPPAQWPAESEAVV